MKLPTANALAKPVAAHPAVERPLSRGRIQRNDSSSFEVLEEGMNHGEFEADRSGSLSAVPQMIPPAEHVVSDYLNGMLTSNELEKVSHSPPVSTVGFF
jgi:hypothetical protein